MSAHVWRARAYSALVSAFCGDELKVHVAAPELVSIEKSLRRQNAFASRMQACAPRITAAAQMDLTK